MDSQKNLATSERSVSQVIYRGMSFEIQTYFADPNTWTFTIQGEGIRAETTRDSCTFASRLDAFAAGLRSAMLAVDVVMDSVEDIVNQLGNGEPVDFQRAGEIGDIARNIALGILSSDEIDHHSEIMKRFQQAFEKSETMEPR